MEDNSFNKITKLVDQYQNWYWTSDFDDINLIEDLRLSSNIHEALPQEDEVLLQYHDSASSRV